MTFVLDLRRLTLRPVSDGDKDFLIAHWSDPRVRQFLFDATPAVAEQIGGPSPENVRGFATVAYGLWLIRQPRDSVPVGAVGLRPLNDLGLEVFYSLTPASWGSGYATEAARGVIDYALGPLGVTEVLAEVDPGNTASAAVIERLGMSTFAIVPGSLGRMTRYRRTADEGRLDPPQAG